MIQDFACQTLHPLRFKMDIRATPAIITALPIKTVFILTCS